MATDTPEIIAERLTNAIVAQMSDASKYKSTIKKGLLDAMNAMPVGTSLTAFETSVLVGLQTAKGT